MTQDKKHIIINVGRQLGSGGHDIGRMLALDFNARYYDRELLARAAQESGLSQRYFEQHDEHKSFLRSLLHLPFGNAASGYYKADFTQDAFFKFQSDTILKAADEGACVFVGRCADYVLRERPNTVNVFITASLKFRTEQVMAKKQCDEATARKLIEQGESQRAAYYNYYTGKRWGHAESYDLCVDSSILGLQQTEKLIADFVRHRFDL